MAMSSLKKKKLLIYSVFAAILLIVFLIQYSPAFPYRPGRAHISFFLPFVFTCALLFREWAGAFYGLAAGAALDIVSSDTVCFNTIALFVICCLAGLFVNRLFLKNNVAVSVLMIFMNAVYAVANWLFCVLLNGEPNAAYYFLRITLPSFALTSVVSLPVYFIMRALARKLAGKQ